jgi:nitrite reductase (NADH) small subunit
MAQHKIAKSSDIPEGQGKKFTVDGQEVAVFNKGGQFFAIDNTCIHKGGSLGDGNLDDETVTCPLHGWQYNITDGKCLANPAAQLKTYAVTIENDEVCLEI